MGDIFEILASSRGFSGVELWNVVRQILPRQTPLASKFETKWAIAH